MSQENGNAYYAPAGAGSLTDRLGLAATQVFRGLGLPSIGTHEHRRLIFHCGTEGDVPVATAGQLHEFTDGHVQVFELPPHIFGGLRRRT